MIGVPRGGWAYPRGEEHRHDPEDLAVRGAPSCATPAKPANVHAIPASTSVRATPAATTGTHNRHQTHHMGEVDGTQGWKVQDQRQSDEAPQRRGGMQRETRTPGVWAPHTKKRPPQHQPHPYWSPIRKTMPDDPRGTSHSRSRPSAVPHSYANEATRTGPTAGQTTMTRRTL